MLYSTREEVLKRHETVAEELDTVIEDVTFLDYVLMELGKDYVAENATAELARGYQKIVDRALVALNNSDALMRDMVQLLNGNGQEEATEEEVGTDE